MLGGFCPRPRTEPRPCLGVPGRRQQPCRPRTAGAEQQQQQQQRCRTRGNQQQGQEEEEAASRLQRAASGFKRSLPGFLLPEPSAGFRRKQEAGQPNNERCVTQPRSEGWCSWSPQSPVLEMEEAGQWPSGRRRSPQPRRLAPPGRGNDETETWLLKAGWSSVLPARRPQGEVTGSSCCPHPEPGVEEHLATDNWLSEE